MAKKTLQQGAQPVNRQTLLSLGWLESKDRECETRTIPIDETSDKQELCPHCGELVDSSEIKKHLDEHSAKFIEKNGVLLSHLPAAHSSDSSCADAEVCCLLCRNFSDLSAENGSSISEGELINHIILEHNVHYLNKILRTYYKHLAEAQRIARETLKKGTKTVAVIRKPRHGEANNEVTYAIGHINPNANKQSPTD